MNYNNLITLNEFFSRPNLEIIIPDFQRGYSWGKGQLDDLWEDLHNIRCGSFHYTGMLTLSKTPNSGTSIPRRILMNTGKRDLRTKSIERYGTLWEICYY